MMLETQISPIFGLTLLEFQSATIAAIVGMGIASISLGITIYQNKKQTKITSANLSLELIKRVREEKFANVVDLIFDNKTKDCNDIILERFLNHMDMIAQFNEDGIVDFNHIHQIYGGLLKKIREDDYIQKIIKDQNNFKSLINLSRKV